MDHIHYDTVQNEVEELIGLYGSGLVAQALKARKAEVVDLLYSLYSRAYDEGEQDGNSRGWDDGYECGYEDGEANNA